MSPMTKGTMEVPEICAPRFYRQVLCIAVGAMVVVGSAGAQNATRERALTVMAGLVQYDLEVSGNANVTGVRVDLPLGRFVIVEPGITSFRHTGDNVGEDAVLAIPELAVQLQGHFGRVRPFAGGAIGYVFASGAGAERSRSSLAGSAGVRMNLRPQVLVRAELRLRGIDSFAGSMAEWTIGLGYRF